MPSHRNPPALATVLSLDIVDPTLNQQVATIPQERITGHEVVASDDGILAWAGQ